ncbi:unnamed protein product [Phaeothamnion confervicola]
MGQTRVLAVVRGPREMDRRSDEKHDRAVVNCEYNIAPFSGSEHKKRKQGDRKSLEVSLSVKEVFETAIMTHLYPRTQIDIYLHVLQTDGGRLPACINAASLALVDAGVAMRDMAVACSGGYVDGSPIVDLNHVEQSMGGVYLPVAMLPATEDLLMAKMESRLPLDVFEGVLRAAVTACREVYARMREETKEHADAVLCGQAIMQVS